MACTMILYIATSHREFVELAHKRANGGVNNSEMAIGRAPALDELAHRIQRTLHL